jgi:hypothetical protein
MITNLKTQIRRVNINNDRYYYYLNEYNNLVKLPSVTTIIDRVIPKNDFLIKWIADLGWEASREYMNKAADYGSFYDVIAKNFVQGVTYNYDLLVTMIREYKENNNLNYDNSSWIYKVQPDLLALHKFINDYNFEYVADSIMLANEDLGFAGEIDLIGFITVGEGVNGKITAKNKNVQRIPIILDIKSGRHSFYENNEIQVAMYKKLAECETFGIFKDNLYYNICNFAPAKWSKEPKYFFKIYKDSKQLDLIDLYTKLFRTKYLVNDKKVISYNNQFNYSNSLDSSYSVRSLNDMLIKSLNDNTDLNNIEFEEDAND